MGESFLQGKCGRTPIALRGVQQLLSKANDGRHKCVPQIATVHTVCAVAKHFHRDRCLRHAGGPYAQGQALWPDVSHLEVHPHEHRVRILYLGHIFRVSGRRGRSTCARNGVHSVPLRFFSGGILLWVDMTDACAALMNSQYKTVFSFHHICVVTNLVFLALLIFHEAYLGHKLGSDLTLMSEIHQHAPSYAYPGTVPGQFTSPLPHAPPGMTSYVQGSGQAPPPTEMPPLADEYAKEYEEIMNSKTPPGHLPQTAP